MKEEEMRFVAELKKDFLIEEQKIFEIIEKILEECKEEYLNSALFTMVLDSANGNRNIFKVEKDIFLPMEENLVFEPLTK